MYRAKLRKWEFFQEEFLRKSEFILMRMIVSGTEVDLIPSRYLADQLCKKIN